MHTRFANAWLVAALIAGSLISVATFHAFRGSTNASLSGGFIDAEHLKALPQVTTVSQSAAAPNAAVHLMTVSESRAVASGARDQLQMPAPPRGSRGPSQLIRTANINIEVKDVGRALRSATLITDEELGDVIGLNDETPNSPDDAHTATMAIRVPEYRFEQTLDSLGRLGKVKAKSVNAQDVSDQIVDGQARLRNLRRTEADILNIMDRSGNIEQVLNVTQELGNVRDQIERLDAQIKSMQYQVAYSTMNITLTSPAVVTTPSGFALLGPAWKAATQSLRDLTVGILSAGLWLVAFSPYILGSLLVAVLALRYVRARRAPTTT